MAAQSYPGPYGNMFGYIIGAGAPIGMPAGSLNQNAFMLGIAASYLGSTTLTRRGVNVYSNVYSDGSQSTIPFATRLTVQGNMLGPGIVGPLRVGFPNRNGAGFFGGNSPY